MAMTRSMSPGRGPKVVRLNTWTTVLVSVVRMSGRGARVSGLAGPGLTAHPATPRASKTNPHSLDMLVGPAPILEGYAGPLARVIAEYTTDRANPPHPGARPSGHKGHKGTAQRTQRARTNDTEGERGKPVILFNQMIPSQRVLTADRGDAGRRLD